MNTKVFKSLIVFLLPLFIISSAAFAKNSSKKEKEIKITPIRIDACIDYEAKIKIEKREVVIEGETVERPFLIWESQPMGCKAYRPGKHPTCVEKGNRTSYITIGDCFIKKLPVDDKHWKKKQTPVDKILSLLGDCFYWEGTFDLTEFCDSISADDLSENGYIFDHEWNIYRSEESSQDFSDAIGSGYFQPTGKNYFSIIDAADGAHYYGITFLYEAR